MAQKKDFAGHVNDNVQAKNWWRGIKPTRLSSLNNGGVDEMTLYQESELMRRNPENWDRAATEWFRENDTNSTNSTGNTGNSSVRSSRPAVSQPRIYTAKELAEMYGINYDYDYILGLLNNASDAKYNESQNEVKKMQLNNARQGAGTFATYLNALRQSKSNAVATGINKGTQAAQELSATLGSQQLLSANQTKLNQEVLKLIDLASTQRANNQVLALDNYNKLGQYLGTLSTNLNANDIQKYVAEMSAAAAASASSSAGASYGGTSSMSYLDSVMQNYLEGNYKNPAQRKMVENALGITGSK